MITINETFGFVTLVSAVSLAGVGLPMQIYTNYRTKTASLHISFVILAAIVYISRAGFALTAPKGIIWYIFTSDAIGSVASLVIIYQTIKYRRKRPG